MVWATDLKGKVSHSILPCFNGFPPHTHLLLHCVYIYKDVRKSSCKILLLRKVVINLLMFINVYYIFISLKIIIIFPGKNIIYLNAFISLAGIQPYFYRSNISLHNWKRLLYRVTKTGANTLFCSPNIGFILEIKGTKKGKLRKTLHLLQSKNTFLNCYKPCYTIIQYL